VKRAALKIERLKALGFTHDEFKKSYQNCSKEAYRRTGRLVECEARK